MMHIRACAFFVIIFLSQGFAQELGSIDRQRGHTMLRITKEDIIEHYYDTSYHAIDLDARFEQAHLRIDQATSNGEVFRIIAQVLLDFNDSHTRFYPPARRNRVEYDWDIRAIGDSCYVFGVKPGSDAEAQGLHAGDAVDSLNGIPLSRGNLRVIKYVFKILQPLPTTRLSIRSVDGKHRTLDVLSRIQPGKRVIDLSGQFGDMDIWDYIRKYERYENSTKGELHRVGDSILIWRMPSFVVEESEINKKISDAMDYKSLVIDLRENHGGYRNTLERLVGRLFDRDIVVSIANGREPADTCVAETAGGTYQGNVIVIISSESASASELFARVMQLEGRGVVVGDRSAGAVMLSRFFFHEGGGGNAYFYGNSLAMADAIMTDGKSLEGQGVIPDSMILPTQADLAAGHDPVLAHALQILGVRISPEEAGYIFPYMWED